MPLSFIPACHAHSGNPGQRNRLEQTSRGTERDMGRGLTCGQGWTPKGQEKQQPCPSHGPPERSQDPAADLRCGLREKAPTRLLPRPQAQLHLSCSTTEPFPRLRGPSHLTRAPKPNPLSRARELRVPLSQQELDAPHPPHLKSKPQYAKPFPSHWLCHLQDTEQELVPKELS